jgi:TetR/AcrR family transcriptional regulator
VLLGADIFFFMAEDIFRHFRDVHFAEVPEDYSEDLSEILLNEYSAKRD